MGSSSRGESIIGKNVADYNYFTMVRRRGGWRALLMVKSEIFGFSASQAVLSKKRNVAKFVRLTFIYF